MAEFRITALHKSFVINNSPVPVIRGLELAGDTEEITVILGRSGCGKTTLLKLVAGLEQPDSGNVLFPGGARLGVVFQEPRLMPWLDVEKNITFGLAKAAISPAATAELVRLVGLDGFEHAYPAQLSGGMQQRAALARMLACRPQVVLMDEPFAALDYFTRATMQQELLRIHRETGMGVIFVTHNLDEALILGDRICIMAEGRIARQFHPGPSPMGRDLLSPAAIALKRSILSGL